MFFWVTVSRTALSIMSCRNTKPASKYRCFQILLSGPGNQTLCIGSEDGTAIQQKTAVGRQQSEDSSCKRVVGRQQLEEGGWKAAVGRQQLEEGGWKAAVGRQQLIINCTRQQLIIDCTSQHTRSSCCYNQSHMQGSDVDTKLPID